MPHTAPRSSLQNSPSSGQEGRLSAAPEALFAYGTLQFPEILVTLLDRVPEHTPAQAEGWRVVRLAGRPYPGLVSDRSTASGFLITGLSQSEWRVLDAFEDTIYDLRRLELTDGRQGWAYVCKRTSDTRDDDWSPEEFSAEQLPAYIERCSAWRQRFETKEQTR